MSMLPNLLKALFPSRDPEQLVRTASARGAHGSARRHDYIKIRSLRGDSASVSMEHEKVIS